MRALFTLVAERALTLIGILINKVVDPLPSNIRRELEFSERQRRANHANALQAALQDAKDSALGGVAGKKAGSGKTLKVKLTILEARHLQKAAKTGWNVRTIDPYVKLFLKSKPLKSKRTSTIWGTQTPSWMETFIFRSAQTCAIPS